MGLQSLPVAFGVETAKWICVSTIDVTQLGVAAYLYWGLHETTYAAVLLGLILPQVRFDDVSCRRQGLLHPCCNTLLTHINACCAAGPPPAAGALGAFWVAA